MAQSDVARIKQEIEIAYLAGKLGLSGLASGVTKHAFIEKRTERLGTLHSELQEVAGEQAIVMLSETLAAVSEQPTRYELVRALEHELGTSEATAHLIDWLFDLWETFDYLIDRFGEETASKIVHTPATRGGIQS